MGYIQEKIRTEIQGVSTGYDLDIYHRRILKMNSIIAIVVFVIEVAISTLLYVSNAIEQTLTEYFLRFLIFPTAVDFTLIAIQSFIYKSKRVTEYIKNICSVLTLTGICIVVAFTHYTYSCTLLAFLIPIFTSVLFIDKRITGTVECFSLLGVVLAGMERKRTNSDMSKLAPEMGIAIAVVFLSGYVARIIISLISEQNNSLVDAKDEADRASKAKGDFLANMSHEIRTPINAILGLDTMILRKSTEDAVLTFAKDIQSAGRSLLSLINDVLDFSKIESGKMKLICDDYDFASLINDVVNMITPKADEKGLEFFVDVDESMPAKYYGDDTRIKQILVNLLNNAVKYTKVGCVMLQVRHERAGDDAIIHFSVKDTGIGIKKEDISLLSEEFVRIEEARNKRIEGTGLGINIVINFLHMMGSTLQIESTYGEGSNFHFDLIQPITLDEELGDLSERINEAIDSDDYQVGFCIPGTKLLVVDDNSMNRLVFLSLLKDMECEIDEAESGAQCLQMVEKKKYDIIFMDHMMPEMDGIETFNHMKEMGDYINAETPVVILTANAISGAREEYMEEGFIEYLTKPIDTDRLENVIGMLIPDDKKKPFVKKTGEKNEAADDMPSIDGVDWQSALYKLKDKNLLLNSIKTLSASAASDMSALKEMYSSIISDESEKSFDAYRIKVHSMKSNAAIIGAFHVAGLAKYLEYAARDKELATIKSIMPLFECEWDKLRSALNESFSLGSTSNASELPRIEKAYLKECLEALKDALDGVDFDAADAIIEELDKFSYSKDEGTLYDQIKQDVLNLDTDAGIEKIDLLYQKLI